MRKMTLEIIIIALLAASATVLGAATVRYRNDARDSSKQYSDAVVQIGALQSDCDDLKRRNAELTQELNSVNVNYMMLERAFLDITFPEEENREEQQEPEAAQEITEHSKERLPEGNTNWISGMPLTSITNKRSEQWKLQCDTNTFTGDYGIRCYNDGERTYFLSAMGSAYGRTIGDAFRITLQCSTVIYVMLGEFKDDGSDPDFFGHTTHQDGTPLLNCDGEPYTCVLEFIYDADELDPRVGYAGTFTKLDIFGGLYGHGGNIVKIEYLGRRWKP